MGVNNRWYCITRVLIPVTVMALVYMSFSGAGLALNGADVAIYNDTAYANGGAWAEGLTRIKAMLDDYGYTYEDLTPSEINVAGNLTTSRYKVLIVGGGWAASYNDLVWASGQENIRSFIGSGGGYMGICAGAYFACDLVSWTPDYDTATDVYNYPLDLFGGAGEGAVLGIIEFTAPTGYTNIQYGASMTTVDVNTAILSGVTPDLRILYFGGPWFEPYSDRGGIKCVAARYQVPGDPGDNKPAMVLFPYGSGKVFLTGPHPEVSFENGVIYSDPATWTLMNNVLNLLVGTVPSAPKALLATSITPTGFSANWQESAGATNYLLDVATDMGFASPVSGYNDLAVGRTTTYQVAGLNNGDTYYYRVCAQNAIGRSAYYGVTTVTTGSPGTTSVYEPINDFDGDGKSDMVLYQESTGYWYVYQSTDGLTYTPFGANGYTAVEGDYDGDGKSDLTVYDTAYGYWFTFSSRDFQLDYQQLGGSGYDPVRGDFDGDGRADFGVYQTQSGYWYLLKSSNGDLAFQKFGASGYVPARGDLEGDGKTDLMVYQESTGYWYWLASSTLTLGYMQFGATGYAAVSGDYDGDGKTDLAVYHQSTGFWYVFKSSDASVAYQQLGAEGYVPVPGDYDGDVRMDYAVYEESTGYWYVMLSSSGEIVFQQFGASGYVPVQ